MDEGLRASQPGERARELYITAHYYTSITGELDKARGHVRALEAHVPEDSTPYNNLSVHYLLTGQYEKSNTEAQEARRLEPASPLALVNLGFSYLLLDRLDESRSVFREAEQRKLLGQMRGGAFWTAEVEGDRAELARLLEGSRGQSWEDEARLFFQGRRAFLAGRMSEARSTYAPPARSARQHGSAERGVGNLVNLAWTQGLVGMKRKAKETIPQARAGLERDTGRRGPRFRPGRGRPAGRGRADGGRPAQGERRRTPSSTPRPFRDPGLRGARSEASRLASSSCWRRHGLSTMPCPCLDPAPVSGLPGDRRGPPRP